MSFGMVAVDLGASSARFAAGVFREGRIEFEVIEQIPHRPHEVDGRETWDLDTLLGLCRRAWDFASANFDEATVGIDSWGVDHGFVPQGGETVRAPVAYRDRSHQAQFEAMADLRPRLYELTGIQHQPFNTIYQLAARAKEGLPPTKWLLIPDLMGYLLTGVEHCEATMASTTQLVSLDGTWCKEAFEQIGWPVPQLPPSPPGRVLARRGTVSLVSVGSHDTASAVFGLGTLEPTQAFLNVGTWALLGVILDRPVLSSPRFTNERAVDGRVRYLTNIPGFYVVNRVFEELGGRAGVSFGDWLASARAGAGGPPQDLTQAKFFNPESMAEALGGARDREPAEWAALTLDSMAHTTARELADLEAILGRRFEALRVSGGGSRSRAYCQAVADATRKAVIAGPEEATLLGNFGVQLVASGHVATFAEASAILDRSIHVTRYLPS